MWWVRSRTVTLSSACNPTSGRPPCGAFVSRGAHSSKQGRDRARSGACRPGDAGGGTSRLSTGASTWRGNEPTIIVQLICAEAPIMESDSSTGPASDGERSGGLFEFSFRGRTVELAVHPAPDGLRPASAGEVCAALKDLPLDSYPLENVLAAVKAQTGTPVAVGEIESPADTPDDWAVKVSPSKLAAYVLPVSSGSEPDSAETGGPIVSSDDLRGRLAAAGVTSGLLEDVIAGFSPARTLESATKVAQGIPPSSGQEATFEFGFDPNPRNAPVEQEDGSVDYRAAVVSRFVDEGALLVTRHPAVPGRSGMDVFGALLLVRPVSERMLSVLCGKGTRVVGETLVATSGGRPVLHGAKVEVLPVYEVKGDVDFSVGNIEFNGDVVVGGDVHPGFAIRAEGSVTVKGIIDRATVTAGKDIMARGISGDDHSHLEAGNEVVAHYLHNATVTAGALVKAHREIVNCTIHAVRVETAPNARIVGGVIEAVDEVDAGIIGSPRGVPTEITVLRGSASHPPVVRARRSIHSRVVVRVHHMVWNVDDDYKGTSFWEFQGEISRLGPAASAPKAA
ncbi:MAG: hypothetical protein C0506_06585 [Anaerolinea sp.]|nr:hypothetical protein [Anaerolinea sp.]